MWEGEEAEDIYLGRSPGTRGKLKECHTCKKPKGEIRIHGSDITALEGEIGRWLMMMMAEEEEVEEEEKKIKDRQRGRHCIQSAAIKSRLYEHLYMLRNQCKLGKRTM